MKDDLWKLHSSITNLIQASDTKASSLIRSMVIFVALLGLLFTSLEISLTDSFILAYLIVLSFSFFFLSLIFSLFTLFPTLKTKHVVDMSLIYFNDIAKMKDVDEYKEKLEAVDIENELKEQIFIISNIAKRKFNLQIWSIYSLSLSLLFLASFFLVSVLIQG